MEDSPQGHGRDHGLKSDERGRESVNSSALPRREKQVSEMIMSLRGRTVVAKPMSEEQIRILTDAMRDGMRQYHAIVDGEVCLLLDEILFQGMLN